MRGTRKDWFVINASNILYHLVCYVFFYKTNKVKVKDLIKCKLKVIKYLIFGFWFKLFWVWRFLFFWLFNFIAYILSLLIFYFLVSKLNNKQLNIFYYKTFVIILLFACYYCYVIRVLISIQFLINFCTK